MVRVSPTPGLRRLWLAVVTVALGALVLAQEPLRNQNIIDMKKAGIDDATVLKLIRDGSPSFDTSVQALITLKKAGVSDQVIDAIVTARRADAGSGGASSSTLFDVPDEIGVYVNARERLVPLKVELVTWRTGGELKKLYGNRGHLNGVVSKPWSTTHADARPEFIIRLADGVAPEEYQLLRFWKKGDRREFRIITGGVFHAGSGAEDNLIGVDVERIATRTYRIRPSLPLQNGEYGFLPPGAAASGSVASSGKIYTFRVEEKR